MKHGDVLGIIGRNGVGRQDHALGDPLSRIAEPSEGASLLEVGTGFHPELSGRENIYLSGSVVGMTRVRTDANSIRSLPSPKSKTAVGTREQP